MADKKKKRGWSLKWKFILAVSVMIVVMMTAVGVIVLERERQMIMNAIESKGVLLARELAIASANKIVTNDYSELVHYVDEVIKDREVAYVYIFEDNGQTCVAAVDEKGSHHLEGKKYSEFSDEVSREAFEAKGPEVRRYTRNGMEYIDIAVPIMVAGFRYGLVRVGQTLEQMEHLLAQTRNTVLAIMVVSILLGIMVSVFMAGIILKPVSVLVRGVDAVSVGDFNQQIRVETSDELGHLANAFNRMTYNISVLYSVSNAMNFIADSDRLLKLILDKALEALMAERGSLMLLDEEGRYLQVKVVRGLLEETRRFIKLKVGEGIAGYVAETGMPLIVNRGSQDSRFKSFSENQDYEHRIGSLLCVPLKMEDKVLGCLNIVNKKNGENFNEDDVKLLTVLASQAAVTLNKARLYEESITDGLTKLFIHRYFQIKLEEEIKRARRYGSKLSLIMFDIDKFKSFNDTYGHQQGDIVLRITAQLIRETIRESIDIACRYGGEEFAVIMPETDRNGAYVFAERLRKKIEAYEYPGQSHVLRVTISLGIAQYPDDADEKTLLIRRADAALYRAKRHGRNRAVIFEPGMEEEA